MDIVAVLDVFNLLSLSMVIVGSGFFAVSALAETYRIIKAAIFD